MSKQLTPKEKAQELVDSFMKIDSDSELFDGFKMDFFYAQRCALIALSEKIKTAQEVFDFLDAYAEFNYIGFEKYISDLKEFKQEIETL
jgi:hypothetical protein